uniref:Uncharacterized protein n=1 Tax=Avena sativa TaxID=4498 RepID=A0ACD5X5L7_AVESA
MGDAEEMPRWVSPEKRPCVDGQTQPHSPTSMGAAVSKVFDDGNLLGEIIVRVGFPTTLVCAALVCKSWFCHISNRKFLSRFRKLNPPGMYIGNGPTPKFVPMLPQPPELAAAVRRVESHNFAPHRKLVILDCQNGNVFTSRPEGGVLVHVVLYRPLLPESGLCILPPLPATQGSRNIICDQILPKEEEGGLSYLYVLAKGNYWARNFMVRVYKLQNGVWCMHTSATEQIRPMRSNADALLVGNKIYMIGVSRDGIIVFDLTASSISIIALPQRVSYFRISTTLSRADDASGVYLTHLHELQLHIWLHNGDNWLLVHTFCLHEMFANLGMLDHTLEDGPVGNSCICHVGDNAEFVFFQMRGHTLYLDVKSRTLRKVHGVAGNTQPYSKINPFMMIWPPTFPALKDDPVRNAM